MSRKVAGSILAVAALVGTAVLAGNLACNRAEVSGKEPSERVAAIHQIAVERPPGAGKALARAAADDPSALVRGEAMAGLGHFLTPEHRAAVEKGVKDPDGRVRAIAASTLGMFGDKAAADTLVELIETDEDDNVVKGALRGIGRCDDPRAVVMLMETAEKGESSDVKMAAMKGLLRWYGGRIPGKRDPDKKASWRDLIQRWKQDGRVRAAYAVAGARLVDRPQDIIGKEHCKGGDIPGVYHPNWKRQERPSR